MCTYSPRAIVVIAFEYSDLGKDPFPTTVCTCVTQVSMSVDDCAWLAVRVVVDVNNTVVPNKTHEFITN